MSYDRGLYIIICKIPSGCCSRNGLPGQELSVTEGFVFCLLFFFLNVSFYVFSCMVCSSFQEWLFNRK